MLSRCHAANLFRRPASTWAKPFSNHPCFSPALSTYTGKLIDSKSLSRRCLSTSTVESKGTLSGSSAEPEKFEIEAQGPLASASIPRSPHTFTTTYQGPLGPTFKRLKVFSLASLGLSTALTPFMFIVESSLPTSARVGLAGMALTTSGISTLLVGWAGAPYVTELRHICASSNEGVEGLEMTTMTLTLRKIVTRVYDVDFLVQTERPFAKWELANIVSFPPGKDGKEAVRKSGQPGEEETVAETTNATGEVLGRWIVRWEENGVGRCRHVGKVIR